MTCSNVNSRLRKSVSGGVLLLALGLSANAFAETAPPQGVVNLSADASVEVAKDWISVTLSTQRDGSEAAGIQTALKQALDAALQEARKIAKTGQVELQAGNFSLSPRYTDKGQTNGWRGSTELIVEGRDMDAIAQLTGRIKTLSIARVGYSLSREQRQKAESEVTSQAISNYRASAAEIAKNFGFSSYLVREVSVSANGPQREYLPQTRVKAMSASVSNDSLPVEAGLAIVTVSVNGSVQMLK